MQKRNQITSGQARLNEYGQARLNGNGQAHEASEGKYRLQIHPRVGATCLTAVRFKSHLVSKVFTWSLLLLIPTLLMGQASNFGVIPQPNHIESKSGTYTFGEVVQISGNNERLDALVQYASNIFTEENNWRTEKGQNHRKSDLRLELNQKEDQAEGAYRLEVNKKGILISAANEQGIFYGLQTLRQLVSQQQGINLAYVSITDAPRFGWRAYMLDEGRYFQGMNQVKKLLDEMARLKMNVFHWHLVDDQGWRIEIKKYPLLTEVGSKRKTTQVGPRKWDSPIQSGEPHEGYYTQEEIKEIIAYAEERFITVVPEIEMPGHSSAAIAAYPWIGSSGKQIEVPINFGVSEDIFNVADPKVYDFLTDVLDEVMALFPSKVIHIGGDEAKYDHWENSEEIRAYMKKHNLPTFADLQVDFTNRISNYIESKGRKMMGWNEILGKNVH